MTGPYIDRITAHIVEMRVGFTYSSGTLDRARAIIWEVAAGHNVGLGECQFAGEKSTPGISLSIAARGEQGLHAALSPWVGPLLGQDASQLEALLPPLPSHLDWDQLVLREGLSIALYDLVGQAYGLSVSSLLGGRRRSTVPGMPVVHVAPPDVMVRRSRAWLAAGYRALKVKLRGDLDQDTQAVQAIRQAAGSLIIIQVDANDGYQAVDGAERAIRALSPFGIDLYEDLLAAPVEQIAELRRRTGARIMIDRQAYWPYVHDVISVGAADAINHHPNNQGGLAVALQIEAVAVAAGLQTAVGSSGLFGIQNSAFQALSTVIGLSRPCEDIGLLPYYAGPMRGEYDFDREPTVLKCAYSIRQGTICVPDTPGLGIELARDQLERCTIERIEFTA